MAPQVDAAVKDPDPRIYDSRLQQIAAEKKAVHERISTLETERARVRPYMSKDAAEVVRESVAVVRDALNDRDLTGAEKRSLLARIIDKVIPEDEGVTVHFKYPSAAKGEQPFTSMTLLELSGIVRRLPGNCYIRVL